jgi:hypothetical protein
MSRFAVMDLVTGKWVEVKPGAVHPALICPFEPALVEIEERLGTLLGVTGDPNDDPERWREAVVSSYEAALIAVKVSEEMGS